MKNLRSYIAIITVALVFCAANINAQNNSDIPNAVTAAFAAKYPKAEIKSWNLVNDLYVAKAKDENGKYSASFDKSGAWVKTTIKYSWPWHLKPEVKAGFKKSKYSAWHIYAVNKVEKPTGEFYEILIDDANHKISAFHQELLTTNWLLEFKANGEFITERNINDSPAL
jgi:hypothetical protein